MEVSNEKRWLTVTDHSVSGESFTLYHDTELDLLATHPQPNPDALPAYYESPNYISHTDSKRSLFEKMYHFVKQLSLKRKVKLINRLNKKGMLLDVGAGTGDFLLKASQDGWQATGIEPSNKARRIAEEKGCRFVESSAMLPGASFDVITMWHVLEHVPDPVAQLQELSRLLKPTGTIIIAVPNFRSFDAQHYGEYWAAYDVPRHLWHFSKTSIQLMAEKHKLKLSQILPMKFDAFYVSLLSEKYRFGKMNFLRAFFVGLRSNWYGNRNKEHSSHIYILKKDLSDYDAV